MEKYANEAATAHAQAAKSESESLVKLMRSAILRGAIEVEGSEFEDRLKAGQEQILSPEDSHRNLSEILTMQETLLRKFTPSK